MTPEPRLEARCASSGSCSPKKRRKIGSLSSGWRCERISFEVKMLTTEGAARCTASWYEPTRTAVGSGPVVAACCTTASGAPARVGSHSGRKVETTNRTATATVAACAKMSQRRYIEETRVYKNSLKIQSFRGENVDISEGRR